MSDEKENVHSAQIAADGSVVEQFGYKQELNRVLTLKDLIIYGMLFMVIVAPAGIFGEVHIASGGMAPFVYLVGLCAMTFTALSYKQMSHRFPIAGSVYTYVSKGINPHIGFITGWLILIDYILIPALLCGFVGIWCNDMIPVIPVPVWVVIFLVVNTAINIRGIKYTAIADWVIFIIEIIAFVMFVIIALRFVLGGGGYGAIVAAPIFDAAKINLPFVATAASIACLSFLGFDGISTLAEETIKPEKTVGNATVLALVLIGAIFILFTYTAALAWGPDISGLDEEIGFFQVTQLIGGDLFRIFFLVVMIIAAGIANMLTAQAAIVRILFGMSRDGMMPKFMSKVHKKFQTPYLTTIFIACFTLVAAMIPVMTIVRFINFGALSSFIVLNFTVIYFFFIKEKNRTGFKNIFFYLICPAIGMFILGFVWTGFDWPTLLVGFSWLAAGIIIGAVKSKGFKEIPDSFKNIGV